MRIEKYGNRYKYIVNCGEMIIKCYSDQIDDLEEIMKLDASSQICCIENLPCYYFRFSEEMDYHISEMRSHLSDPENYVENQLVFPTNFHLYFHTNKYYGYDTKSVILVINGIRLNLGTMTEFNGSECSLFNIEGNIMKVKNDTINFNVQVSDYFKNSVEEIKHYINTDCDEYELPETMSRISLTLSEYED
jgi:hypothetical protein